MREILFKGAGVNIFDASVRESRGVLYGYRYISLHKMAVWSDVRPWCSFVEMRVLLLCLENSMSSSWPRL